MKALISDFRFNGRVYKDSLHRTKVRNILQVHRSLTLRDRKQAYLRDSCDCFGNYIGFPGLITNQLVVFTPSTIEQQRNSTSHPEPTERGFPFFGRLNSLAPERGRLV